MERIRNRFQRETGSETMQLIDGYNKVFDLMPVRIWHIDSKGIVIYVNEAVCRDLGLSLDSILGKKVSELFPQTIASRLSFQNDEILQTGQPMLGILEEHKFASDGVGWFRTDKLPYMDDEGSIIGVIVFSFDISDYKKTEEALHTSRIQISEAMDLARIVYWQLDPATEVFIFNDPFYAFYGTSAEREGGYIMSREEYGKRFVHPDDMDLYNQAKDKRILYGDREFFNDVEHRIIRRDGQVRHVLARIRAIMDARGRTIRCYGANQDISDRKLAEAQLEQERFLKEIQLRKEKALEQSREELRHLSEHLQRVRERERTRIAREVHDELGQFLTALKIDLTFLGQGLLPEQSTILDQIRTMELRINSAVHKVREICSELRPSILDDFGLSAAIEWHAEDYQKKTGIQFFMKLDPHIPIIEKRLASVLFRIFQEAVTNVIRHAEASKVRLSLKQENNKLVLKVSDNGKGISKNNISSPSSLGIIGIRERVRFWNGELQFKSSKNKGTTITVSIPHFRISKKSQGQKS
jgi:two-component system, NarL family, sensor histidine kinase UhpB